MAYYEERHMREHNQAKKWLTKSLLWTAFWTIVSAAVFLPLSYVAGKGFSAESLEYVKQFYIRLLHQPIHLLIMYWRWFDGLFTFDNLSFSYFIPGITFIVLALGIFRSIVENPFYFGYNFFGSARWANDRDIAKMKLLNGFLMFFGRWKGKDLKLPTVASALCIAAPGNNKTTSVVVPSILSSDSVSMFINDPKGELFKLTAGYRATLGPVFRMYWDAPDDLEKGIIWPRWNPLGPNNLPAREFDRQSIVDGMASTLIPDGPEGTDPYWINAGRNAFKGLALFLVNKVEQAMANDYFLHRIYEEALDNEDYEVLKSYYYTMEKTEEVLQAIYNASHHNINKDNYLAVGTWKDLPDIWVGREPSFPMMVDWMTTLQIKYSVELKDRRESGDVSAYSIDPWDIILTAVLRESAYFGYERQVLLEVNDLLVMPSKQRSSVLSTTISGLTIFKNAAIREKTVTSDWLNSYGRGWKNPATGQWEPVSVYIYIPPLDLSTSTALSTLFVTTQMVQQSVYLPNQGGRGPYGVMFVLDDLHALPKIGYLNDAMSAGRWQKVSFLLVVQSLSQISAKYGQDSVNIIINNTAAKLCLGTNNDEVAKRFGEMTAKRTAKVKSVSQSEGIGSGWSSPFIKQVSWKYQRDSLMATVSYECIDPSKIFMLYQGYYNRPIMSDRVNYWQDKKMMEKVSIPTPKPLPDYIYDLRSPEERDFNVTMSFVSEGNDEIINDDESDEENDES